MRNFAIVLTGIAATLALAGVANADTSAYNRYETEHRYNGHSSTDIVVDIESVSKTVTESTTLKVEAIADLGDVNVANVEVTGTVGGDIDFSADAHSRNGRPADPIATVYVTEVNQRDVTRTTENVSIETTESYDFSGSSFEHEVGNRF